MAARSGLFQINVVTVGLVVALGSMGYAVYKVWPVFWQAQKADEVLAGVKFEASKINMFGGDPRQEQLENRVRDELIALGIDERYLEVGFSDSLDAIHANYIVEIPLPFGQSYTVEMERSEEIPRPDLGD